MKELALKYGCNPNQGHARVLIEKGDLPFEVLNGRVGYINLLDALNAWQLVREFKTSTGLECATSFKHLSPTSMAFGELSEAQKIAYGEIQGLDCSPLAKAYLKARGADRISSFGDFIALSGECDEVCARVIAKEVSDGIIAPSFSAEALEILKQKKQGNYIVLKIDSNYEPKSLERREVFGITFEQERNGCTISSSWLEDRVTAQKHLPKDAELDLLLALHTLKYTQSNSICFAYAGQAIGVGAGQQSRIHCTLLAASKARMWHLKLHPKVLRLAFKEGLKNLQKDHAIEQYLKEESFLKTGAWQEYFLSCPESFTLQEQEEFLSCVRGVSLGSDAFFPFADNIDCAYVNGVSYIVQPGGSLRDSEVIERCDEYQMLMAFTGLRLFHH